MSMGYPEQSRAKFGTLLPELLAFKMRRGLGLAHRHMSGKLVSVLSGI